MEKLPMCRLCLAQNVRMYVVVNKDLHELYERLTDNPFVTGDSRPMLACFICCTKLKQCCQLQRKCLEAEERLAQMMNEDYELNSPFIKEIEDQFGCCTGLTLSPMEHVSIQSDDGCQTECDPIKEELPDVCERLDDVFEPKEEDQSDGMFLRTRNLVIYLYPYGQVESSGSNPARRISLNNIYHHHCSLNGAGKHREETGMS
ncbi:hypothetical protein PYW08_012414 [Mythimna loreyi]|uniref:Uncharacterized protein n=1 Tax=Mythimna loreyi TaxID=667449 RepID=A0ACC2Q559_9NEOP|nr:hypothetical protein PYW08_012414 [Mythimna loreyi]